MWIPKEIDAMASRLKNGQRVKRITVRRLLQLFDAERRGVQKVHEIKSALNGLNLETDPDFEHAWIDSTIKVRLKGSISSDMDSDSLESSTEIETEIQPKIMGLQNGDDADTSEDPDNDNPDLSTEAELDESEETTAGQLITEPFDPTQIRIETKQLSLDILISRMQNNEIILQPEFQRNEVWKHRFVGRGMNLEFCHPEYSTPIVTSRVQEIRECAESEPVLDQTAQPIVAHEAVH